MKSGNMVQSVPASSTVVVFNKYFESWEKKKHSPDLEFVPKEMNSKSTRHMDWKYSRLETPEYDLIEANSSGQNSLMKKESGNIVAGLYAEPLTGISKVRDLCWRTSMTDVVNVGANVGNEDTHSSSRSS